ncbi:MAG: CobW family GTP-binding protein [bacterium]
MTKIDIITGFLGAGKTTLIRKLLQNLSREEKIVLIENEFGEVNIDSGFLQDAGIEITEISSGCICCTLIGDFSAALQKIKTELNPDRIIIEPSGVAMASDIRKAISHADLPDSKINSLTAVVDAECCADYADDFGEFYHDQIKNAGCLVLSHTAECGPEKTEEAVKLLRALNNQAVLVTAPWSELTAEQLVSAMKLKETGLPPVLSGHRHHCADEHFSTVSIRTTKKYSAAEIKALLEEAAAAGRILRMKGIVSDLDGGWLHFDYIPEHISIRQGTPAAGGMISVIGCDLDKAEVLKVFTGGGRPDGGS